MHQLRRSRKYLLKAKKFQEAAVLVTGAKKAATLRRVAAHLKVSGPAPHSMPITGVNPVNGQLTWFLDPDAAGTP